MKVLILILGAILFLTLSYISRHSEEKESVTEAKLSASPRRDVVTDNSQGKGVAPSKITAHFKSSTVDWSKPPDFTFPKIKLWKLEGNEICYPIDGSCRPIPSDKMYCVPDSAFEETLRFGREFVNHAKSNCLEWGPDSLELMKQKKKFTPHAVRRPPIVETCIEAIQSFHLNQTHISWIYEGKLQPSPYEEVVCFSDKDREKIFEYYAKINRRCVNWGI